MRDEVNEVAGNGDRVVAVATMASNFDALG